MSRFVAIAATILAVVLALASLQLVLSGRYVVGGTLLTFVAFAIYVRELNTE